MIRSRLLATFLLVLGLIALVAPVMALANGGGSAGDQQYVDPLASQHTHSSTTTSSPTTSSSPAPAPSTSTATPAPPPATSAATTSSPSATTPTATIATGTNPTGQAKQLPYTGYDSGLAAGLGFVLVLGGAGLRQRARRASSEG